jgi:hypothetical protein
MGMSDQQTTTTILTTVAARCRATVEQHRPDTIDHQRSVSEIADAALVSTFRHPNRTILTLGIIFVITGGIASLVTGGIGEAIHTAALLGALSLGSLLLNGDLRPTPAAHWKRSHADESAESSTHSTPTTEEAHHD